MTVRAGALTLQMGYIMPDLYNAIAVLEEAFPNIEGIRPGSELGYADESIFLGDCAEGGKIDEKPACNYYVKDYKEETYVLGVHKKLVSALDELGYFCECHDPGTYIAYEA